MSSVPQPHRPVDLILGANESLGRNLDANRARQDALNAVSQSRQDASLAAQKQEDFQNFELNPQMQAFMDRIMAGEDPVQVGQEAAKTPGFLEQLAQGGNAVQSPASAANRDYRQQLPTGAPPPQAPVRAPAPQASIADPNWRPPASFRPGQSPALGPGVGPSLGQPTQGAPQVTPAQAGAVGSVGGPPPQRPQVAPPQAAPAAPAPHRWTQREFQQLQPALPSIVAAQGRSQAAKTTAGAKIDVADKQALVRFITAKMREDGKTQAQIDNALIAIMGEEGKNTRAAAANETSTTNTAIKAGAAKEVAATNASGKVAAAGAKGSGKTQRDPRQVELAEVNKGIDKLVTDDNDLLNTPNLKQELEAKRKRRAELEADLNKNPPKTQAPTATDKLKPAETGAAPAGKVASPKEQQALDWANRHPNDPRSAAIKAKLGK